MAVRRILFRGSSTACAKWLPFAKDRLKTLSTKTYKGRRHWTWERRIPGGAHISLEQNGPIQYIRITAGLFGYEFNTQLDSFTAEPGAENTRYTIVDTGKIPDPDDPENNPKIKGFIARGSQGGKLNPDNSGPANAPDSLDDHDRWLRGGRSPSSEDEEPGDDDLSIYSYPTQDWFEVTVPQDNDEAAAMADGVPRRRVMLSHSFRSRQFDLSLFYGQSQGTLITPYGSTFHISSSGRSKLTGLSSAHSEESPFVVSGTHFPRAGASAAQGKVFMSASWRGDDFLFEARNENYTEYITGSSFFFVTKPSWVGGDVDVYVPWQWRGDGERCVSLQYNRASGDDPDIDAGFVELELLVDDPEGEDAPGLPDISIVNDQHNLDDQAIHPIGIDYRMLDQRKKVAYYLERWIGPTRSAPENESDPGQPISERDLLIYLVCAEIDSAFPGTELWRIPVWHGVGWQDTGSGMKCDILYPSLGGRSMLDSAGNPVHPYRSLRGVVAAMDCRAEALAVNYKVLMHGPHTIWPESIDEYPVFGKYWRIWGDVRQNTWIDPDLTTGSTIADPGDDNDGERNYAVWHNADPSVWEDADPPQPDPTVPPGDFFTYLASPPPGYALFPRGHANDTFKVQDGILAIMSLITQQCVYQGLSGTLSPWRSYAGFRISPTKSFALSVPIRGNFNHLNGDFSTQSNTYHAPWDWWVYDFIEKNQGPDKDPLTTTHGELYNSSRGTDLSWYLRPYESFTPPGNLNANGILGVWVE